MTLQKLAIFAAVARHRSLTKASQELLISEPSISLHMKELQQHYSTQLFQRASKGVVITAEGQAFLLRIVPILNQIADLENGAKPAVPQGPSQVLKVGGTFSASAVLLPKLLARMRLRYPGAEFEICTGNSDQLERQLSQSRLDLTVSTRVPPSAELTAEPLRQEMIALFVLANHRLAKKANLDISSVLKEPLVLRGAPGGAGVTDKAISKLRDSGAKVRIAMYCDGPTGIKAAVRQKMGVGVALVDSIKSEVASGEFKILKVSGLELVGQKYVVYSKKRPLSALAQEFLEMLRNERDRLVSSGRSKRASRSTASLRSNL